MTVKALKESCEKLKLYRTPRLNDKLYLHYKGYREIKCLDEYTGLRVLFLEGNGLGKIEGLDHQAELRTLYLQENIIETIENLEACHDLDTLNLCQNTIKSISGVKCCQNLKTLLLKQNNISSLEELGVLSTLPELTCVDLANNKIDDPAVLDVLEACPKLAVLYMAGNPCVKKIKHYRKILTCRIKSLKYLDDRPVFPEDRLRAEAWWVGMQKGGEEAGKEAERAEISRQREEKRAKELENFKAFEDMMIKGLGIRVAREAAEKALALEVACKNNSGAVGEDTDTATTDSPMVTAAAPPAPPGATFKEEDGVIEMGEQEEEKQSGKLVNPHSGEEVVDMPERPEAKAYREQRVQNWINKQRGVEKVVGVDGEHEDESAGDEDARKLQINNESNQETAVDDLD